MLVRWSGSKAAGFVANNVCGCNNGTIQHSHSQPKHTFILFSHSIYLPIYLFLQLFSHLQTRACDSLSAACSFSHASPIHALFTLFRFQFQAPFLFFPMQKFTCKTRSSIGSLKINSSSRLSVLGYLWRCN
ncbi:unnamed protein product [Sphenostylis stenocarpa]|uniref:Uncharacterized protein n=1 Tax=Sphenostylis stenocarpa TaxID=92480 RepID=A0AA86SXS7_9FABA|nr:unnamed protein product [Sphenostylis stenocarpa]